MIKWLKKHFIPHEGNDHRPHFLRKENIRNVVILILFLETFAFLMPTLSHINREGGMAAVLPAVLSNLTNEERQAKNLSTLTVNPLLVQAAEMKAEDMATKGYFAHTSPEGKTPWYWLDQVGYKYQYAGENLAINFSDSKDVTEAWMNSPTHRANIIKDKYTEVGTGIATGVYDGKETIFVAQVYANPLVEQSTKEAEPQNFSTSEKEKVIKNEKTEQTAKILGAETSTLIPEAETEQVEMKAKETPINTQAQEEINKISDTATPTFWQKLIASPRNSTNTIFFVIGGVIVISLLLNIFIKIKHHHPDLITNGLITLAVIGLVIGINYIITHREMMTTKVIDYSSELK